MRAQPESLLVGGLRGGREGGAEGGIVAEGEDGGEGGARTRGGRRLISGVLGVGDGNRGVELEAEVSVNEDGARSWIALHDPLLLFRSVDLLADDGSGRRGEGMVFRKGVLHERIHHVAGTPDAHADAHLAVFFRRERVAARGGFGAVAGEAWAERLHMVLGFDLDAFAREGLHGVVAEVRFEHVCSVSVVGFQGVRGSLGVGLSDLLNTRSATS